MANARYGHTSTLLSNGNVLVTGGFNGVAMINSSEIYDPESNLWSAAASLVSSRYLHTATLLSDGKVLVVGGANLSPTPLSSVELYSPALNKWTSVPSLAAGRNGHSATLLASGKVLVAGGKDMNGQAIAAVEIFDPVSMAWSSATSLNSARYQHTATLLTSGQVLVAGGYGSGNLVVSAELYDPTSNTWSPAGNISDGRYSHTASLLLSGQVLIAGGEGESPCCPTAAEKFTINLGFADSRRPTISSSVNTVDLGGSISIVGGSFTGDSEAAGGGSNSSATNFPLVQLRRSENGQINWASPASNSTRSATNYSSAPLFDLQGGTYVLTMYVNGIPSFPRVINVLPVDDVIFIDGFDQ